MTNPTGFKKRVNTYPFNDLINKFNKVYSDSKNNPSEISDNIPKLLDLQTRIRDAIKIADPVKSTPNSTGPGTTLWIKEADEVFDQTVNKLDEIFKLKGNRAPAAAPRPVSQPSSIPAECLSVGFGNMQANCWANALLSMIVFVPGYKEAYKTVADHYAKDSNAEHRTHGASLQRALTEYDRCFANGCSVDMKVSQDVRLAFNHFFPDNDIAKECSKQQDAQEAMQLLMQKFQNVTKDKRSAPILFHPIQTKRLNTPKGIPKEPEPKMDYSKATLDYSSQTTESKYEIFLELQNNGHLAFPALIKSSFCSTSCSDSDASEYMLPDGTVQTFALKSAGQHFIDAPKEFLLTMKRYAKPRDGAAYKIKDPVKVERIIVLPPEATAKNIPIAYELDSFIVHWGDYGGGHYINYKKIAGIWIEANDNDVKIVPEEDIDRILHGLRAPNCTSYMHHYVLVPEAKQAEVITKLLPKADKDSFEKTVRDLKNGIIPESVKQTLFHIIWLNGGAQDIPEYGKSAYENNPQILNQIDLPWLIAGKGNLAQQMLFIQETKLEIAKNQVYAENLTAFLQKLYSKCPHAELVQAFEALPEEVRWEIETLLHGSHKIKYGAAHVDKPYYGKLALQTKNIYDLLTSATEFVRNVYGKNIVEQLAADYRIKAEKLQRNYESGQLQGFYELLKKDISELSNKQLAEAFKRLDINDEIKLKIQRNIAIADNIFDPADYGRSKLERDPRHLLDIKTPLFLTRSEEDPERDLLTQLIFLLNQ